MNVEEVEGLLAQADAQRERFLTVVEAADALRHPRPRPGLPAPTPTAIVAVALATAGFAGLAAAWAGSRRRRPFQRAPQWTVVAAASGASGVALSVLLASRLARAKPVPRVKVPLLALIPEAPMTVDVAPPVVMLPELEGPAVKPVTRRAWFWALAVLLVLLVAARLSLDPLQTALTHKALDGLTGYKGTFSDVAVSLIPLRVTITDLRLVQDGTAVEDAVLFVKELRAQVAWSELLRARIEATAIAKHAHFRVLVGQTEAPPEVKEAAKKVAAEIKREDLDLGKILHGVIPFKINRLELRDSEVTLTDATDPKRPKFWIKDIEFVAENLVSREELDANVPLLVSARATVQKTGVLKLLVTADLLARKPTFTGQAQLSGLNLESIYEWAAAKAGVSPHGTLDLFANFNSAEGALAGDVKLLARDVRVDALEGKLANAAKAAAINVGAKILSDEKHDRVVATTLPLRGSLEKPDAQIWPTVLGLIRNAFIDSLEWGFGDLPLKTAPKPEGVIPQTVEGLDKKNAGPAAQPGAKK
jgi:hypothetical protein